MSIAEFCYMCDSPATSREHIPPRCFFPEKKDLPLAIDYRKELITVPSCDTHNLTKSKDDEYLLLMIVSHDENNLAAQRHFSTKIMRVIKRKPHLRRLFGTFAARQLPGQKGVSPSLTFTVDKARFDKSLDWVARGLYFHHYHEKWSGELMVVSPDMFAIGGIGAQVATDLIRGLDQLSTRHFAGAPQHGAIPDVFYYQTYRERDQGLLLMRLVFYGGFVVLVCHVPLGGPVAG